MALIRMGHPHFTKPGKRATAPTGLLYKFGRIGQGKIVRPLSANPLLKQVQTIKQPQLIRKKVTFNN